VAGGDGDCALQLGEDEEVRRGPPMEDDGSSEQHSLVKQRLWRRLAIEPARKRFSAICSSRRRWAVRRDSGGLKTKDGGAGETARHAEQRWPF
jgi:hypothetical protein